MTLADELAEVLDDGDNLRVIPIVTYGAASNLDDLLYLRGVDVAMVQSDVFEYFRTQRKTLNLERRIHYISRLPVSEIHVLAGVDIKTIEDLRGKKVNFGPAGSASSLTGTIVFQRLGVKVDHVLLDNATALQKLKSGELAGLVRVIGKPVGFFAQIPADSGLHLVPIPFSKTFADMYTLGEFTREEYPTLIPQGRGSTLSRCRRCSQFSTGRKIPIAIGVCESLPRLFSRNGTSFWNPTAIQNGVTSILQRPSLAGPVGA